LKTQQVLPRAAMRAGKRAARREVQKHIDFTEGHLAKNHSTKGPFIFNFRVAAFDFRVE
jgi:hypothetical protein